MSITLPTSPAPTAGTTPRYLDFGSELVPPLGGPTQRLNRIGNRFAIDVALPPMRETLARPYIAALIRAKVEGAVMRFPQPGVTIGTPGTPLVLGGNQSGETLVIDGLTPGYVIRAGQFFSILHGGRRYLHMANLNATANGSGQVTLSISPMLRIIPADNAVVEIAQPMIEGFIAGSELPWTLDVARIYGLSFSITEVE